MASRTTATDTTIIRKHLAPSDVQNQWIDHYSTKKFGIEYGGYLSNHLLHLVVALYELGATKHQIDDFAEHYAKKKLEPVTPSHEDPYDVVAVDEIRSERAVTLVPSAEYVEKLLGKRQDFDALLAFYGHEVKLLGTDGAVKKHLPSLVGGLSGALLHGIIQLGYAFHIGGDRLIAEGLAYFHFSYLSYDGQKKHNESSAGSKKALTREEAVRLVHAVRNHEFVLREVGERLQTKAISELPLGGFQKKLNALSAHPERGSKAAFELIASTLDEYDLSKVDGNFALDFTLWLYAMIGGSDFVIVHAVTSAWSLKQMEHLLDHDDRVRAWRVWLHVAICAFILVKDADVSASDICDQHAAKLATLDPWQEIINRTLALQDYPDEHVYKLVQVAHEHAAFHGASFLSSDERAFVTRQAASKVIVHEFDLSKL
ncbi:Proteasome subunit beta type-6, partial [Globisporangium splendens]